MSYTCYYCMPNHLSNHITISRHRKVWYRSQNVDPRLFLTDSIHHPIHEHNASNANDTEEAYKLPRIIQIKGCRRRSSMTLWEILRSRKSVIQHQFAQTRCLISALLEANHPRLPFDSCPRPISTASIARQVPIVSAFLYIYIR